MHISHRAQLWHTNEQVDQQQTGLINLKEWVCVHFKQWRANMDITIIAYELC